MAQLISAGVKGVEPTDVIPHAEMVDHSQWFDFTMISFADSCALQVQYSSTSLVYGSV